ncbi:MAG: hypothetical protein ACREU7_08405 [Burkholderiales bacterium]
MKRVIVHIDRLVLKGFGQEDHRRIAADLQGELGRLLANPVAVARLTSQSHVTNIRVGKAENARGGKPVGSGISAARAIARGLSR